MTISSTSRRSSCTSAQIANKGDTWIEHERYTIEAKALANSGITNFNHTLFDIEDERLRGMLQALLIDRFTLRCGVKPGRAMCIS